MYYKPRRMNKMAETGVYLLILFFIAVFAFWINNLSMESSWQKAGFVNFSLGIVMLSAYVLGQTLKLFRLPLISGYIFAGILLGPYIIEFLTKTMVGQMRLLDDLALSFIALAAGGEFNLQFLYKRFKPIVLTILFLTLVVFGMVFLFVVFMGRAFSFTSNLTSIQITALALLLGVVAVARSPSSAIAIISECRAKGVFTETALGVTIAMDVLIIILFTLAMAGARIMLIPGGSVDPMIFGAVLLEIFASIFIGTVSGKIISFYIERAGHDLSLFLLFFAFGVTKISFWFDHFMESSFDITLHLEPLIICMSTGFFVQNFSKSGHLFMESLDRVSLPIFVLFFSIAGASLNIEALRITWPLALCIAGVRIVAIFISTFFAGILSKESARHNRIAWMAYITQAGVAIGLAQLAKQQFPEIGEYLNTIVLAVITINQIIGPVTFKMSLNLAGEARNEK